MSEAGWSGRAKGADGADYDYRCDSSRCFEDAVGAVEDSIGRHGFKVRLVHDLQATLAVRGFSIKPIRIYELDGTPELIVKLADLSGLRSDDPRVDRLMPCRVNVFVEDDRTVVTALRPTLLARVFPESELEATATVLEEELVGVVNEAAGRVGAPESL